ncbi:hypothetical protein LCGC14_1458680, partial [marine sediment metagenome]
MAVSIGMRASIAGGTMTEGKLQPDVRAWLKKQQYA